MVQLSAPARTSLLQLATQQLSRRPPSWFACRHPLYSTLPDPPANHTGPSVDQPKPAEKITPTPSSSEASPSQAAQEHSPEDAEPPKPPPFLPRPLGVQDPPSTRPPTEEEKLAKLVDERARLQERKHLISEVSRGYYHDWNQLRHNGNKLWTAPPSLIQDQRALYFPNISGVGLANKETKHTTDIFAIKSPSWPSKVQGCRRNTRGLSTENLCGCLSEENNLQLVRLNVQENPLKSWLVSLFINNLRKTVPASQHSGYMLSNQSLEYVREPLGMVNKLLGYVYLVDWNMKVRWAACGFANADEVAALLSGTRTLLKRFQEHKK
ncbi:hypothetical protein PCANC_19436 [Puccinia coronata f. sp. avenae]|uniref:Mitochondrial ATPase complex subunit ATP10 n=1 Tax=Puccinia coronata f. sp. avenae TaxID=200324 RepID=A0A2N5V155_9BASI|nr:hypothetical protein PCANC_19436 [Puccinia coronata f. sp. avenae]